MSTHEDRVLTGARWSLACRTGCARSAMYGAQRAPEDELTPEQRDELQGRYDIGNDLSDGARARDIIKLTAEGWTCIPEAEVPWPKDDPIGTGHADVFAVREAGGDVEASGILEYTIEDNVGHKCLQAAGYAINAGASAATVIQIDRRNGRQHHTPIDVEGLRPQVEALEQEIRSAIRDGDAHRVCNRPIDGQKRGCPFSKFCFRTWEPPELDHVIGLDEQLRTLADLEDDYAEAKTVADAADEARKAARSELRPYIPTGEEVVGAVDTDASAIRVKVSVSYRTTFSISDARKAGHDVPEHLRAFEKTSESERWTIRRIPGAAS